LSPESALPDPDLAANLAARSSRLPVSPRVTPCDSLCPCRTLLRQEKGAAWAPRSSKHLIWLGKKLAGGPGFEPRLTSQSPLLCQLSFLSVYRLREADAVRTAVSKYWKPSDVCIPPETGFCYLLPRVRSPPPPAHRCRWARRWSRLGCRTGVPGVLARRSGDEALG
jgi:hypothetical protein